MSDIIITSENFKKFSKRLQKQIQKTNPDFNLMEAQEVLSKTLGFSNLFEFQQIFQNKKETTNKIVVFCKKLKEILSNKESSIKECVLKLDNTVSEGSFNKFVISFKTFNKEKYVYSFNHNAYKYRQNNETDPLILDARNHKPFHLDCFSSNEKEELNTLFNIFLNGNIKENLAFGNALRFYLFEDNNSAYVFKFVIDDIERESEYLGHYYSREYMVLSGSLEKQYKQYKAFSQSNKVIRGTIEEAIEYINYRKKESPNDDYTIIEILVNKHHDNSPHVYGRYSKLINGELIICADNSSGYFREIFNKNHL
jgi:hypothetical protein